MRGGRGAPWRMGSRRLCLVWMPVAGCLPAPVRGFHKGAALKSWLWDCLVNRDRYTVHLCCEAGGRRMGQGAPVPGLDPRQAHICAGVLGPPIDVQGLGRGVQLQLFDGAGQPVLRGASSAASAVQGKQRGVA